jgi:trans-aconitate methyltransferase
MKLSDQALGQIAARCWKRWDRHYVPIKLATDPVYAAVADLVLPTALPVLDIGCGIGLLTHYLRGLGFEAPITGFDYDARKIESATVMAEGLSNVSFSVGDARTQLPPHAGHVVILDILQFFQPEEQNALLRVAAERLAPGGCLVIRSGVCDDTWRYRVTVAGDWLAKATFWMKSGPVAYPTLTQFEDTLSACGLQVNWQPLWGGTPFNNYLITATKP